MSFARGIVNLALLCLLPTSLMALAQAQASVPHNERNAALRYWMAFAQMQDSPADKTTSELLESTAAGKTPWNEVRLGPILDANREALQIMQRGTELPTCDWGLEYDLGPAVPIAHLAKARVMARLNTLAGMRLAARGQFTQAIDTWLVGVRFSRHIAQGGSLISLLTARIGLSSNLEALKQSLPNVSLNEADRTKIQVALRALPESAFDWSTAFQLEQSGLEVFVHQLSGARDPKAYYRVAMGVTAPANFSVPTPSELAALGRVMARAAAVLRLSPQDARQRLNDIEDSEKTLHPLFKGTIPSLSRINDVRAELYRERQNILEAISPLRKR
jgi:hypothetical protein